MNSNVSVKKMQKMLTKPIVSQMNPNNFRIFSLDYFKLRQECRYGYTNKQKQNSKGR